MKNLMNYVRHFRLIVTLSVVLGALTVLFSVTSVAQTQIRVQHEPITLELITLLRNNPEIVAYLQESLAEAATYNPDPHTNPAHDLESYYDYLDQASKLAPMEILNRPSDLIRDQILQSICYFYFLIDQPVDALAGRGYYKNALQYYPPFAAWTRDFATAWGSYLNTTASWSPAQYQQFYDDPNFRLDTGDYEPSSNWNTFNRFFARNLASPSKRPIAGSGDATIVTSPADSVPQGVWNIDQSGQIEVDGGLGVKNLRYYNVRDLLGPQSQQLYGDAFNGGTLTHTFLNVFDYHRYHFAVGGSVTINPEVVQQNVALEVTWNPTTGRYVPIDSTGWQFTQTRGIVIVDTASYGLVALIPMGMAHVSSVNFEANVIRGANIKKGDMLGTFLFGGSDFIMLFSNRANFRITAPQQDRREVGLSQYTHSTNPYQHILMGEEFGRIGAFNNRRGSR